MWPIDLTAPFLSNLIVGECNVLQGSPLIDILAGLLVVKLGDGQARIREAAMNSLISMAR